MESKNDILDSDDHSSISSTTSNSEEHNVFYDKDMMDCDIQEDKQAKHEVVDRKEPNIYENQQNIATSTTISRRLSQSMPSAKKIMDSLEKNSLKRQQKEVDNKANSYRRLVTNRDSVMKHPRNK